MSLSAEEFANRTLTLILSKAFVLPLKPFSFPRYTYLFNHDLTRSPVHSTWVTHVKRRRRVRARSSKFFGQTIFHRGYKYPLSPSSLPLLRSTSLSSSSLSNPSAAATSSSPVRKSFTASTSLPSYSRRPRKSSLSRRRSRLPPLS